MRNQNIQTNPGGNDLHPFLTLTVLLFLLHAAFCPAQGADADKAIDIFAQDGKRICDDIEKITGLKFKKPVPMKIQAPEEFRAYILKSLKREFGEQDPKDYVKALVKLGALEESLDLPETLTRMMESQALAHYDPKGKVFYLLKTDMRPDLFKITAAHELCHALQDQHHDLGAMMQEDTAKTRDNADAALAKQCLVEGQATLVMMLWLISEQFGVEQIDLAEQAAMTALKMQASLDPAALAALSKASLLQQGGAETDSLAVALDEMQNMPQYFIEPLIAAYLEGAQVVYTAKSKGGWESVEAMFAAPPLSTEQVLHPGMTGHSSTPVDVRLPQLAKTLAAGWRLAEEDVMGEICMRVFLKMWLANGRLDVTSSVSAAEGWGGDRYYLFDNAATGRDLLVWKLVWDTKDDATEFAVIYRMTLPLRFPNLVKTRRSGESDKLKFQIWEVEPGRFLKLASRDNVVIVTDTTDREMLKLELE